MMGEKSALPTHGPEGALPYPVGTTARATASWAWRVVDGTVWLGGILTVAGIVSLFSVGSTAEHLATGTTALVGAAVTFGAFTRVVRVEDRAFVGRVLLAGLLLRLGLALLVHFRLPVDVFAPDQFTFQDVGWRTLQHLSGRGPRPWQIDGTYEVGYFYWNAAVFKVFGFVPLAPKLVNVFLGTWTGLAAYALGGAVAGPAGARGAAALTLLMPSLILWSTQNLREAAVTLLNTTLLFAMVRLHVRPRARTVLGAVAALGALALLRDYLAWMAALTLVGALVLASGRGPLLRLTLAAGIGALWFGAYAGLGFGADLVATADFESIDAQRRALAFGGTAFAPWVDISTPVRGLAFLPLGATFFLLAPFPWQVGSSMLSAMAFPETVVWYCLLGLAALGGAYALRRHFDRAIPLVLFLVLTVSVYGLVEGNAGTAYRHRSQLLVAVLVFASLGFELVALWRARRAARG